MINFIHPYKKGYDTARVFQLEYGPTYVTFNNKYNISNSKDFKMQKTIKVFVREVFGTKECFTLTVDESYIPKVLNTLLDANNVNIDSRPAVLHAVLGHSCFKYKNVGNVDHILTIHDNHLVFGIKTLRTKQDVDRLFSTNVENFVRFLYEGKYRYVRVTDEDSDHIKGIDVTKPDLAKAFRNFLKSKITGDVVLMAKIEE